MLLNIQQLKLKSIQRLSLSISETLLEIPTFHGEEGFGLAESATQSTQLVQNKNITTAGIALVKAAAVVLKNCMKAISTQEK